MNARHWLVGLASVTLLAASLYAADAIKLEGIKCPVAGNKPAKAGTEVDYKGGKVFFCCQNCPKAFGADTAKFAEKANHQLAATKQAKQLKCPLTGEDINPDAKVSIAGVDVNFCCEGCQGKVTKAKDAEKVTLVFADKPFDKAFKVGADKDK